jgi:amino acid transporter
MAEPEQDELVYESAGLPRTGTWWTAFVIGLAGTILVTGIAPTMVTTLGASSIPIIIVITFSGWLLCLFLAELSAMMPDRTGGSPSYAYPAYKDRWPRFAEHVNGFTAWAYWLGWFPVAPLNMILASFYIVDRFHLSTAGFTPIHTPIAWWTVAISVVGLILLFIPSYRGLRFGTAFATTLALLSMIPLTFLAISWIFNPSAVDFGNLAGFKHINGASFTSPLYGHGWLTLYIAFSFLLTWNVIAMEAAACYIGETRNPDKDAKIAMNLEGGYGVFIYTMIPVAFVIVLGNAALHNAALVDPKTIFVHFAAKVFGTGPGSSLLTWLIAWMLIIALILSALNAITGTARSLHQMATDGQFPRFFHHTNSHGVPDRAMIFNICCSIAVVFMGGAGRDLHVLERRLPRIVHPRPHRLLPAAKAPAKPEAAVQAARVDEVRGAGARRGLLSHLLLRRADVRVVLVLAGRTLDAPVLLHRDRGCARLPAAVLVPQALRR